MGVTAVVIMTAINEGAKRSILREIDAMGSNLMVINAGKAKTLLGRLQTNEITTLKVRDGDAIMNECSSVRMVAPAQESMATVKVGTYSTNTKILGTTPEYAAIRNSPTQQGGWFNHEEERACLRIAVIGSQVRDNLFEEADPIGETIRINNIPFEVVGVLITKGVSTEGSNEDNQIIIPLKTALRRVFNKTYLMNIYVQARDDGMDLAEDEIRSVLRRQHRLDKRNRPDDFDIQNQRTVLRARIEASRSLTPFTIGLAGIALLVGGIGILAIMLLAVKERTGEIGLRMAVGARSRDVLVQFLSEALILGLLGGLIGVLCGILGSWIVGWTTNWQTAVPIGPLILALIFSITVGLGFGVIPAWRASLLDPIEALRSE